MKEIKIYYSYLKIVSLLILSIMVFVSSLYSATKEVTVTSLVLLIFSGIFIIYFQFIIRSIMKPVVTMNKDGVIYAPYGTPKFFIPKDLIVAILLRNTPNKRIIITVDPNKPNLSNGMTLEEHLKHNIVIPDYIGLKKQNIPHMYGHGIAIRIEFLNVKLNVLNKEITDYFAYYNKNS